MLSRRRLLVASGAATVLVPSLARGAGGKNPFTLGVASGSPRETGVVLWTRLAPEPLQGGGMARGRAEVRYRVCSDPAMKRTVRDGVVATSEAKAHSVHVRLQGLEPGREYWYQFHFGEDDSPVGRTRTSSPADAGARLALASCQDFESGYYAAYADMAAWGPDCVIHVGDYIYEGGRNPVGVRTLNIGGLPVRWSTVRQHSGGETSTLWDYRNRYALYRTDASLQAAHAAAPWIVSLDDHEIDNDWAGDTPQDPERQTPLEFKVRRLAALQAYYEHMPLEQPPTLRGVDAVLRLYGAYRFGPAQVCLLDTRQHRSDQTCAAGFPGSPACDALLDPKRTMTGAAQEQWLLTQLSRSNAPFNVLAQQTWFAPYRYKADPAVVNMDQWDGYPVQRQRIIDALARVSNPIVLSGDWHCAAAMNIHREPMNVRSGKVAHEFAGTSISTPCFWAGNLQAARDLNPHAAYVNGDQRGYLRCIVDRRNWISQYRVVADPGVATSPVTTDREIRTHDM